MKRLRVKWLPCLSISVCSLYCEAWKPLFQRPPSTLVCRGRVARTWHRNLPTGSPLGKKPARLGSKSLSLATPRSGRSLCELSAPLTGASSTSTYRSILEIKSTQVSRTELCRLRADAAKGHLPSRRLCFAMASSARVRSYPATVCSSHFSFIGIDQSSMLDVFLTSLCIIEFRREVGPPPHFGALFLRIRGHVTCNEALIHVAWRSKMMHRRKHARRCS